MIRRFLSLPAPLVRGGLLALAASLAAVPYPAAGREAAMPSTALVLAIDVSGSIDELRYHLQLEGVAEALKDPVTLSAIFATGGAGI